MLKRGTARCDSVLLCSIKQYTIQVLVSFMTCARAASVASIRQHKRHTLGEPMMVVILLHNSWADTLKGTPSKQSKIFADGSCRTWNSACYSGSSPASSCRARWCCHCTFGRTRHGCTATTPHRFVLVCSHSHHHLAHPAQVKRRIISSVLSAAFSLLYTTLLLLVTGHTCVWTPSE